MTIKEQLMLLGLQVLEAVVLIGCFGAGMGLVVMFLGVRS